MPSTRPSQKTLETYQHHKRMPETLLRQEEDSLHLLGNSNETEKKELVQPIIASASTRLKHFRDGESRILTLSVLQLTLRVPEALQH